VSGNERRSRGRNLRRSSWDQVADWYDGWVGDRGSAYHRAIAIPAVLGLLEPQPDEDILDVGAGQGALAPYIAERGARYTGVDASPRLVAHARRRHDQYGRFYVGDARALGRILPGDAKFDAAVFLLSLQDMDPLDSVLAATADVLKSSGRIVMLLTHPAFRQPRHSG
jgi:SAM-dependent methyltransferase